MTVLFNLGSALLALTQELIAQNESQEYVKGRLTKTLEAPFTFQGLFTPKDRDQIFAPEADRVTKKARLITKTYLQLNRKDNYCSVVTYQDEQYKVIERGDWSDFGYYSYTLELIITSGG